MSLMLAAAIAALTPPLLVDTYEIDLTEAHHHKARIACGSRKASPTTSSTF